MNNYIEIKNNHSCKMVLTVATIQNLSTVRVKNFYRNDYYLIDFVKDIFNAFTWEFSCFRGQVNFKEFINILAKKYSEVEYLKKDILDCITE